MTDFLCETVTGFLPHFIIWEGAPDKQLWSSEDFFQFLAQTYL